MKTIDLNAETPSLGELLLLANEENLILRTADGREFLIAELDEFDQEIALVRQNKELMDLLDERSKQESTYSLEEARRMLGLDD